MIGFNALAQITVTDADLVNVGDVIYQAYDTVPASSISVGNSGANQTWDFSSLQVHEYDTTEFLDPAATPFATSHPAANLCVEDDDGSFMYIDKSSSGVNLIGFDNIPYPKLLLPLPLTYGMNTTVGPVTIMDSSMVNSFLPDSLAMLITMWQAQQIDSIKIVIESSTEFNVDAFGDITIPMGVFDALRVKVDDITSTNYSVYCTDTSFFGTGSAWYPMPSTIFPSEVEVISSYQWWTNDVAAKFAVVEMEVDSFGDIEAVDFLHTPISAAINDEYAQMVSVYPIPASDQLIIESKSSNLTDLTLRDVMGKLVLSNKFTGTTQIDLTQMSKGVYYLNLKTAEGELTKKIIVK